MADSSADSKRQKLRKRLLVLLIVLVVAAGVLVALANVLTEYWWFEHLGFGSVFATVLLSRLGIGAAYGLLALVVVGVHLLLIKRLSKPRTDWTIPVAEGEVDIRDLVRKVSTPVIAVGALIVAIIMGVWASRHWEEVLKFFNQTPFGRSEPILGQDVGFYLFALPALEFTQEWSLYLLGLGTFLSAAVYFFRGAITMPERLPEMSRGVRAHLLGGVASVLLVVAWGFRLEMYELLFSKRGVAYGATFTDVYANLPVYRVMIGVCVVCAAYLLYLTRARPATPKAAVKPPAIALAVVVGLYIIGIFIVPTLVQKFIVDPNELDKERPYLEHTIAGTRAAYDLDRIEVKQFPATDNLTMTDLDRNRPTLENVKLWDPRPLRDSYRQLQVIRLYYDFPNISIDRYWVNNGYRQVMVAAREMVHEQLAAESQRWVNTRMQYTHGYGVVMSPVNQVVGEGLPDLWIKDIPPVSPPRFGFSATRRGDHLEITSLHPAGPAARQGLRAGDRLLQVGEVSKPSEVLGVDGELLHNTTWGAAKMHEQSHRFVVRRGSEQLTVDLEPDMFDGLRVERPEVYYGLQTSEYALVKTTMAEFDYPTSKAAGGGGEGENAYTTYAGKGGVGIGSFFRRLLFAIRFGEVNLLFTSNLKPESRILFERGVQQRAYNLAPFLMLDQEPYVVVADKRLFWIQDAYTIAYRHPYSQPMSLGKRERINYVRNSVKIVVDAYHGTVDFYVWDDKDPMIRTYQKIFPALFKKKSEMPAALAQHVRYPKDLFTLQSVMYESFHMTDPQVFYNQEDKWSIARELATKTKGESTTAGLDQPGVSARRVTQGAPMQPYYMIMRLPDVPKEEFLLMVPYTPTNKDNMVAWMAAGCDGEHYGKLLVYAFPKKKLIFGPMQIEARIDQDDHISQWFTLRNQLGSRVFRGDLLVIPVEDAILYVEPIYLEATQAQLPELKQVIVAFGNRLAMKDDLESALKAVFGVAEEPEPRGAKVAKPGPASQPAKPGVDAVPAVRGDLAAQALSHYRSAQEKLKQGDWAGYGAEQERLKTVLEQLARELQGKLSPKTAAPRP